MAAIGARVDGVSSLSARALGAFVDSVVVAPVVVPVTLLVHPGWLAFVVVLSVGYGYHVPQIALWGMTPGARAAGVRVTNTSGQPPGWARATARWATPGLIANGYRLVARGRVGLLAGLVVVVIVYAPALFDGRRRALTDRVSGTVVVDRARGGTPPSVLTGAHQHSMTPVERQVSKSRRARGLALAFIVALLVSSSLAWWLWATSRADHQAQQQAMALKSALSGLKPYQLLFDPTRALGPNINLVTMYGDPNHVVIQVQPRSLPHLRCVVANLDASGHYDVSIQDSGCRR